MDKGMHGLITWHVAVLIPARNEEKLLPRCLRSLLQAKEKLNRSAEVDIVVISDRSSDRTAELAAAMLGAHGIVCSVNAGAVGTARRVASKVALRRCAHPLDHCWLANTDADCIVPSDWLANQLSLAKAGIEALAGTVGVDSFEEHGPEVRERFRSTYLIGADGSHPHVHGANLGVRADCYLRAGGWNELPTAEDHDLWRRLSLVRARKLSNCRIQVETSGRRVGRAPHGFAAALAAHNETAA